LKYLAKFDPVMREHLDSVSGKPGCSPDFSIDIQSELINVLGARVRETIISSVQKAKYNGVVFDATSDTAHVEQKSHSVRFGEIQRGSVETEEACIDFIPLDVKTAEVITA
jgi:hypothetical protein